MSSAGSDRDFGVPMQSVPALSPLRCSFYSCDVQVVFVRHGESTFNQQDRCRTTRLGRTLCTQAGTLSKPLLFHVHRYIGWSDVPLTPKGESEATRAGQALKAAGFEFDIAYSSMLKRYVMLATHDTFCMAKIADTCLLYLSIAGLSRLAGSY